MLAGRSQASRDPADGQQGVQDQAVLDAFPRGQQDQTAQQGRRFLGSKGLATQQARPETQAAQTHLHQFGQSGVLFADPDFRPGGQTQQRPLVAGFQGDHTQDAPLQGRTGPLPPQSRSGEPSRTGRFPQGIAWCRSARGTYLSASGRGLGGGVASRQECGDLPQTVQRPQVFGLDGRSLGQTFLQGAEDLDALDGVNAQVGVQGLVQLQHLRGIARLLRDNLQQDGQDPFQRGCRGRGVAILESRLDERMGQLICSLPGKEGRDVPEAVQRTQVLRLDGRSLGQAFLQGAEDLDPLDGVNAQVGVQGLVQLQHLLRIACLLRNNLAQHLSDPGHRVLFRGRLLGSTVGRVRFHCGSRFDHRDRLQLRSRQAHLDRRSWHWLGWQRSWSSAFRRFFS